MRGGAVGTARLVHGLAVQRHLHHFLRIRDRIRRRRAIERDDRLIQEPAAERDGKQRYRHLKRLPAPAHPPRRTRRRKRAQSRHPSRTLGVEIRRAPRSFLFRSAQSQSRRERRSLADTPSIYALSEIESDAVMYRHVLGLTYLYMVALHTDVSPSSAPSPPASRPPGHATAMPPIVTPHQSRRSPPIHHADKVVSHRSHSRHVLHTRASKPSRAEASRSRADHDTAEEISPPLPYNKARKDAPESRAEYRPGVHGARPLF